MKTSRCLGYWGVVLMAAGAVNAGILRVPENFPTITQAMGASVAGDVIEVSAGTYNSASGETFPIAVKASVTIRGIGYPVVRGQTNLDVFRMESQSRLTGFVVENGAQGVAILQAEGCTVSGNKIRNNKGTGVYLYEAWNSLVELNEIYGNTGNAASTTVHPCPDACALACLWYSGAKGQSGTGIRLASYSQNNRVYRNVIYGNNGGRGGDLYGVCGDGCNTYLGGNGGDGRGITVEGVSTSNQIVMNRIYNHAGGSGGNAYLNSNCCGFFGCSCTSCFSGSQGKGYGIYVASGDASVRYNIVENTNGTQHVGVYAAGNVSVDMGTESAPGGNLLYGHSAYELENQSGLAINARGNWWGKVTIEEMQAEGYPSDIAKLLEGAGVDYQGWKPNNAVPMPWLDLKAVELQTSGMGVEIKWPAVGPMGSYTVLKGESPSSMSWQYSATDATWTDEGSETTVFYTVLGVTP